MTVLHPYEPGGGRLMAGPRTATTTNRGRTYEWKGEADRAERRLFGGTP